MKPLHFFLTLLLLVSIEAVILLYNYWREIDNHLQLLDTTQQTAFASSLDSYQRLIEVFYEERFNLLPTATLLEQAASAEKNQQATLRNQLYQRFLSSYENLQRKGIQTLQFVLKNGESFLRFNHPDRYGDQIADKRPMLNSALHGRSQGGILENSWGYPCFHFTFPIMGEQDVAGAVDFGVSFVAIRDALLRSITTGDIQYHFILKQDLLESITFPPSKALFRPSQIGPDYLLEKTESGSSQSTNLHKIESFLHSDPAAREALANGDKLSTKLCISFDGCYAINLQALRDSRQRIAGYILSYSPMRVLQHLRGSYQTIFFLGCLLTLITLYLFHRWLQITQRLRTISDHMAEGMYVEDIHGKILYANPTASKILKYSNKQLLGKKSQQLIQCNKEGSAVDSNQCLLQKSTLRGETYKSDDEHFRCQDGTLIRVSIVSSPYWINGNIYGAVVLFRNITKEYEIKKRQHRSDVAINTLAEGVIVTDQHGNIEAINQAVTEITGYMEHEVLGKNPRLMNSGRHNKAFYAAMWGQLTIEGHWEGEIWNRRKNGQIYPAHLRIISVLDEHGNISEYVGIFNDITEKRRHEQELHKLAYTDPLTKLHNRTSFLEMFGHALAHAERRRSRCALLYLDLDRFKKINDTLGHIIGDKVLIETAQRLNRAVRNNDEIARLGGDEFIVLLEDIHQDDAPARVARKIISLLRQPIFHDPHTLHITASVGIAIYPEDGKDSTTLLKNADSAMYMAKREGRNSFHYFTQAMAAKEDNRFKLEIDLHTALMNDEFLLRYQPIVNLTTGETTGLEALLHWQHPQRGLLCAGEFLDLAHDAGVMRDITNWVITESCGQMLDWLDDKLEPGRITINIDSHTFNSSDAYDQICRTVEMTGVSPHRVELEISERGLLEKPLDDPLWEQFVNLGFTLSIDDFGTGESSLYRLKHLPVSALKIDNSFVQDIESDENNRSIVRTIIAMGKSLGLKILAEGVENQQQLSFLCEMNCNEAQGFLFSKAQPAETITQLLSSNRNWKVASCKNEA
ncbi:MAG: EAL domain-containing protein [Candidatus Thiodiazotropha sp.]